MTAKQSIFVLSQRMRCRRRRGRRRAPCYLMRFERAQVRTATCIVTLPVETRSRAELTEYAILSIQLTIISHN